MSFLHLLDASSSDPPRYNYKGVLGRGAFSDVLRARRVAGEKEWVALKRFRRRDAATYDIFVARRPFWPLQTETHRFTTALLDVHATSSRLVLVLEMADESLERCLATMGPVMDPYLRGRWIEQMIRAIRFLHARCVVHRDLKPANLLLFCRRTHLKVCDFGLSRQLSEEEQRLRTICGSPAYMAPELWLRAADSYEALPVDVWSVGAIVYELFHRLPILVGRDPVEIMRNLRRGHLRACKKIHPLHRRLLQQCLHVDSRHRVRIHELKIPVRANKVGTLATPPTPPAPPAPPLRAV